MGAKRAQEIMQDLLESEWRAPDCKIISKEGEVIKIHQHVIKRSTYLDDAFRRSKNKTLRAEENYFALNIIVRHLYGVCIDFGDEFDMRILIGDVVEAMEALEKYGLPELDREIEAVAVEMMGFQDDCVGTGIAVYEQGLENRISRRLLDEAIRLTVLKITDIMDDDELWPDIQGCPKFLQAVIAFLAKGSDKVAEGTQDAVEGV